MKYEEQMKDKLEQRTIQPSSNSWQQLSDKLDAEEPEKNRKGFWYIGIAASIVGILLITNVFNYDDANIVDPTIVETNQKDVDPADTKEISDIVVEEKETKSKKVEKLAETYNKSVTPKKPTTNNSVVKEKIRTEQLKLIPKETEEAIVADNAKQPSKVITTNPLSIEDKKAQEVVAQIKSMQKTKEVTDAEIDALLNSAQRELTSKRLYNERTKTIDANALLLSVEDAIEEQSFRAKVFEMLKSGYNEVKTVVAERNN